MTSLSWSTQDGVCAMGTRGTSSENKPDTMFEAQCKVSVGKWSGLFSQAGFSSQLPRSQLHPQCEVSMQWHLLWSIT